MESSKGGMSDRAVHLQLIQTGTVQFESTLAEAVVGTVISEPVKSASREVPGKIRLLNALTYPANFKGDRQSSGSTTATATATDGIVDSGNSSALDTIELWARCVPESLVLRVGDTVRINVVHYRPEEIIFARNLKVHSYRKLGRESGIVKSVRGQGYGFVSSNIRDYDLYFRTSEVVGVNGEFMKDRDIVEGMTLSYEVCVEDSGLGASRGGAGASGSSSKLRGTRAALVTDVQQLVTTSALVAEHLEGIVTRDAKKDNIGVIKLTSSLDGIDVLGASCLPELVSAVEEFISIPELTEFLLENLPSSQRKLYHRVFDFKFPGIAHESLDGGVRDGNKLVSLKVWKPANPEETQNWFDKQNSNSQTKAQRIKAVFAKASTVHFHKSDVNEEFGLLYKDLEVSFQFHVDFRTGNFIAKGVALTDKPFVPSAVDSSNSTTATRQVGVLQVVSGKGSSRFGFARGIPSGQKLFWHVNDLCSELKAVGGAANSSSADSGDSPELSSAGINAIEGCEVSYQIRLRGGLPCAVDIKPLPVGSLREEEVVDGTLLGIVVDGNRVVLLDVSSSDILNKQYWNGKYNDAFAVPAKPVTATVDATVSPNDVTVSLVAGGVGAGDAVGSADASGGLDVTINEDSSFIADDCADATETKTATTNAVINDDKRAPKYFELLTRNSVPVTTRDVVLNGLGAVSHPAALAELHPGDLVYCSAVVNWALNRQPIAVCDVIPATNSSAIQSVNVRKSKGSIVRLKIRCDAASYDSRVAKQTIELCEVKETSRGPWLRVSATPENDAPGGASFFCDIRDIVKTTAPNVHTQQQQALHLGDQVEFYAVSMDRGTVLLAVSGLVHVVPTNVATVGAAVNTDGVGLCVVYRISVLHLNLYGVLWP